MNTKYKFIIFIVSLIGLLVFQAKAVLPFVEKIVSSGAFLEDSDDQGSQLAISNNMTDYAFTHCNTFVSDEIGSDFSSTFSDKPINAWSLGNYQYIVNAKVEITPAGGASFMRTYACRINYSEKDDLSAAKEFDNWSVFGLSGVDNLQE